MNNYSLVSLFNHYHGIIFDLDGVLINSDQAWISAIQNVLLGENLTVPPLKTIEENLALSTLGQIKKFFPEYRSKPSFLKNIAEKVDQYYLTHISENVILVEHSIELLTQLKQMDKMLGVVTNNGGTVTNLILKTFKLEYYFDSIIHLDIMEKPKPDPSALLKTIKKFNINKNYVLFIGDSPSDLEASLRANIDLLLIKNPKSSFLFPKIPDNVTVVSKLLELLKD